MYVEVNETIDFKKELSLNKYMLNVWKKAVDFCYHSIKNEILPASCIRNI